MDYNSNTQHHLNIVSFSLIFVKLTITLEMASLQLLAKYPQLPAPLIGQIETLI